MTFYLPTISSLNRHINISLRPTRERREISQTCSHSDVYNFGSGRCPICYRQRIQSYGHRIRRSARHLPQVPPPPPRIRIPRPPIPILRLPQPVRSNPFTSNNFLLRTRIIPQRPMPGKCVDMKNKELMCSICYCNYNSNMDCQVLPCDHKFHSTCIKKWFTKKQNCPLCRRQYDRMSDVS
jgi:hypothetical protein